MPKIKQLTPISEIADGMKTQTEELYDKIPTSTPPAPIAENVTYEPGVPTYKKPGRKKDNSIIPRQNGKLIRYTYIIRIKVTFSSIQ